MLKSLGLIETIGLTTGITAADAAVKSANVTLVGYELAKGSGRTVIKVEGDVGAVKAAVEAAIAAALTVGRIAGSKIIARPSEDLESMIRSSDTVGYKVEPESIPEIPTEINKNTEILEPEVQVIQEKKKDKKEDKLEETTKKEPKEKESKEPKKTARKSSKPKNNKN